MLPCESAESRKQRCLCNEALFVLARRLQIFNFRTVLNL
jgi:hypothetical protein